ncbi:MAG: hypothetical protein H8D92_02175 [Pelagibacteraceae bacterium]|nr:hypothetical protein [Pelagibacteraceae bacterium]
MSEENKDNNKPKDGTPRRISDIVRKIPVEGDPSMPDNENRFDKNGDMYIHLTIDDSALVVRADGTIELISHDLENSDEGYVGDVEDLNKTFSLVLALASALEDEDLYNRIFHNLNMTLMRKWDKMPDNIKSDIIRKRNKIDENRDEDEDVEKKKRVDEFRKRMSKYKDRFLDDAEEEKRKLQQDIRDEEDFHRRYGSQFGEDHERPDHMAGPEDMFERMESRPKKKMKKKKASLPRKGTNWNPYDETLKAHFREWQSDEPPKEEED